MPLSTIIHTFATMENKKEFLQELYNLLAKYNVEININLNGDTHCLDSWLSIDHKPDPKSWKTVEILQIHDSIDSNEIMNELKRLK